MLRGADSHRRSLPGLALVPGAVQAEPLLVHDPQVRLSYQLVTPGAYGEADDLLDGEPAWLQPARS